MLALALLSSVVAAAPEVAILSSAQDVAELRFQPVGAAELAPVAARFTHVDGATVLGAVLPNRRVVLATATMAHDFDPSFASSLVRLEAGKPARVLVDRLVLSTRPLVTAEGRVFVQRGRAGKEPGDGRGALRDDELTIDEVNPDSGAVRTVYRTRGYTTFLCGSLGRELVVYQVDAEGGRLLLVHADTLAARTVRTIVPLAWDFTVDEKRRQLVYTQGAQGEQRWSVERVDLVTGASKQLAQGASVALLPTLLPDGRVAVSRGEGRGLAAGEDAVVPARGPGFERVRAVLDGVAIGLHEIPSDFPRAFAVRLADKKPLELITAPDARLDIAGVLP